MKVGLVSAVGAGRVVAATALTGHAVRARGILAALLRPAGNAAALAVDAAHGLAILVVGLFRHDDHRSGLFLGAGAEHENAKHRCGEFTGCKHVILQTSLWEAR